MNPDPQMRWLRLWTDITSDPKIKMLAFEDRWHYVAILCMKRRGELERSGNVSLPLLERMVGVSLGLGDRERDELKRRLIEVQLIDEEWHPLAWDKRQFSSDSSTSRVQKHRQKTRNVSETLPKRSRNALRAEQRQSRAEQNTQERVTPDVDRDALREIQSRYPPGTYRQSDWLLAEREIRARLEEGDTVAEMLAGVERYRAQADAKASTGTQFVLSPRRFFAERQYREPFPLPATPKTATEELLANLNRPRVINHDV